MGLAWTSLGGNALYIEAAVVERGEGKGGLRTTGRAAGPTALVSLEPSPNPWPADMVMLVIGSSCFAEACAHMSCTH
jgi:Lon protease (S16) C-terminal proteolytic domain